MPMVALKFQAAPQHAPEPSAIGGAPSISQEDLEPALGRGLAELNSTVEATAPARVAGHAAARDAHPQPDGVLVAVRAQLDDLEGVAALLALAPQRLARATPEMSLRVSSVRASASPFIQANMRTSPEVASVTIAGMSPSASNLG